MAVLDGKALSQRLNAALARSVAGLSRPPGLAVVLVGEDPASQLYVRRKGQVAEKIGFHHVQITLPATTSQAEVLAVVDRLNADPLIDGILVQMPLPAGIDAFVVTERILPEKDVDGFTAINTGLQAQGREALVPCTPLGVMRLLEDAGIHLVGADAVVMGRSNIVGRPQARLLEQAGATVTICHSKTRGLEEVVRGADVLVAAIGKPQLVRPEWIKPGAVVVDVGQNVLPDGRLVGDVDYAGAFERASWITPVPGGVGPMTIAMLMENTFTAALRRMGTTSPSAPRGA